MITNSIISLSTPSSHCHYTLTACLLLHDSYCPSTTPLWLFTVLLSLHRTALHCTALLTMPTWWWWRRHVCCPQLTVRGWCQRTFLPLPVWCCFPLDRWWRWRWGRAVSDMHQDLRWNPHRAPVTSHNIVICYIVSYEKEGY